MREKFAIDPENGQLFQSVCEKAEALKFLEDILRYTELVLFEVKKDEFVHRSERNYIIWVEEQRRQLFAKIPALKVSLFSFLSFISKHKLALNFHSNMPTESHLIAHLVEYFRCNESKFATIFQRTSIECEGDIFSSASQRSNRNAREIFRQNT